MPRENMSLPQPAHQVRSADEFFKTSHLYRLGRPADECTICRVHEGPYDMSGDQANDDPDLPVSKESFFHVLPCCDKLVHQRCLVEYIKSCAKGSVKCVYCGTKICEGTPFKPREKWQEACEEVVNRLVLDSNTNANAYLWMWTLMKSYDAGINLRSLDTNSPTHDFFKAVDGIIKTFHQEHRVNMFLCASHEFVGYDWLKNLVFNQLQHVMLHDGSFTHDLELFLFRVRNSTFPVTFVPVLEDSDSDIDRPFHEQDCKRDREHARSPRHDEVSRVDRFRNYRSRHQSTRSRDRGCVMS